MLSRSANATGSVRGALCLSTASLSPVSDASATLRFDDDSSRASAATASPSARMSTSPGTTSEAGMRC